MNEFLTPIREKKKYYQEHKEEVEMILNEGTKKAQQEAQETMEKVKASMRIDY